MTPSFPLHLLAPAWARWTEGTARHLGVPADYVAAGLLAAASASSRTAIFVEPVAGWREPLSLSVALVGGPGAGKSRALAAVRRLLEPAGIDPCAERCGALLWRDELGDWLASRASAPQRAALREGVLPGVVGALRPDDLEILAGLDSHAAARFLFVWPADRPWQSLAARPAADDAPPALARISALAADPAAPLVLAFTADALALFDGVCARLHERTQRSVGRIAAWWARGAATVAALSGLLALLDGGVADGAKGHAIEASVVDRAVALYRDYFTPMALAALLRPPREQATERVLRWLRATGAETVSREEVRRNGLAQTLDAAGTAEVIAELEGRGLLERLPPGEPTGPGRPSIRWRVRPGAVGNAEMRKSDGGPSGRRRGDPLPIELPGIAGPDDLLPALDTVRQAMAEGRITPAECRTLGGFVDSHLKVIEAVALEKRLSQVETVARETAQLRDNLLDLVRQTRPAGGAPAPLPPAGP